MPAVTPYEIPSSTKRTETQPPVQAYTNYYTNGGLDFAQAVQTMRRWNLLSYQSSRTRLNFTEI